MIKVKKLNIYKKGHNSKLFENLNFSLDTNGIHVFLSNDICSINALKKIISNPYLSSKYYNITGKIRTFDHKIMSIYGQDSLFDKSIEENLFYPLKINKNKVLNSNSSNLRQVLLKVNLWEDLKTRLRDNVKNLDDNKKSLLSIARSLMLESDVLVYIDDLDHMSDLEFLNIVNVLNSLKDDHIIVVSLNSCYRASSIADFIYFFEENRLVEMSTAYDFFISPKTSQAKRFIKSRL